MTHFNATELLKQTKHKPYHFCDNLRIRERFPKLLEDKYVEGTGRGAATWLPNYCKEAFMAWKKLQTS